MCIGITYSKGKCELIRKGDTVKHEYSLPVGSKQYARSTSQDTKCKTCKHHYITF